MVRTNHWTLRYGIAVAAIIWSTASLLLVPVIGRSGASIPFFAVLISTWFGGLGPGLFTITVGVVLYLVVLVNRGSDFPPWQILQLAFFVAGGAMITTLVEVLHAARRRAEANERRLSAVLSERELLLAAEQAARSEAELANRAKDRFLAVLSHELRTPLTPVLIAASSLLEEGDHSLDPSVRSVLEMVQRNVELESRLIDDLLDVSRIARGRLVLDLKTVDVHQAIRDCVDICRDETSVAGLDVVLDLAAGDHHVKGDRARLMQVVWNLVRNAARFTPGGGKLSIRTSNTPGPGDEQRPGPPGPGPPSGLIVDFTDTGIGIDPAIHERIFEPFYQGDADVRRQPEGLGLGLGLGLAISRSIAEAHGGRLSLQSPGPNRGATFRLALGTVTADATTSPEPIRPPSNPPGRSGLNVLLVEDNLETLRYLTLILQKRNYNVVPVDRLSAALAAAGKAQFDLLISDIELPDGTGLELIRDLGGGRTLPGIAISGFGSEEDLQQSAGAGFAEHLTKPIDVNRLESAIRRVTSSVATRPGPVNAVPPAGSPS